MCSSGGKRTHLQHTQMLIIALKLNIGTLVRYYTKPMLCAVKINDMYILRKISSDLLFYVDRNKTKKYWWSYDLKYAMVFNSKTEAEKVMNRLKYGTFEIITLKEAKEKRAYKDEKHEEKVMKAMMYDDHPFSPDALGQW